MSFGGLYYPAYTPGLGSRPRYQSTHPFRNLVAAGTNMNNQWSSGSGQSGYGAEPAEYDYHSGPPAHVPSGGSYAYQATTGTGYGPPAAPVHPPVKVPTGGGKKGGGKKGSSALSALTLLSFLFFINLLQTCIKDHMDAMSPTVMVMTTNVIRNRLNKMGEMNSREQNSASAQSFSSNAANIVMQPADLVAAAAAHSPAVMEATKTIVQLQSPYSSNTERYNKPSVQQPQYNYNSQESEVPVNYAKPYYDPHNQPDPYEGHKQQLQHLQPTILYANHSINVLSPPFKGPQLEHHYNYHHTEYHNAPQSPIIPSAIPQYSTTPRFPKYEYQYPPSPSYHPYQEDNIAQYSQQHEHKYQHNYDIPPPSHSQVQQSTQNGVPWSSHSSSSASVVSGPFRRATIVAVSPSPKWITVPAKIKDHTNFDGLEEDIQHHDDREIYHKRLN